MTDAKFTPGPWRAGLPPNDIHRHPENRCEIACLPHPHLDAIEIYGVRREYNSQDEMDANAHLIAAAPDLYAAVKAAMTAEIRKKVGPAAAYEWLEAGTIPPEMQSLQDYWPSWFKDAASAFAKARGKP